MATRDRKPIKRVTTEFVDRDQDDEQSERRAGTFEFDPAEESFAVFRSKFGTEGVVIKVYRRTPRGVQYCFSGVPSEIDEEVVRLYHAKQPYASEEGQYSLRCFVNGEGRDPFPVLIGPQVLMPGDNQNHGGMAQNDSLVRLLDRMDARLAAMESREREPLSSLADTMVKLQGLQGARSNGDNPDTVLKWIQVGKQLSGVPDDSFTGILKDVIKEAGPGLLQGLMAARLPAQPAPAELPAGNNGNGGDQMQMQTLALKQGIAFLKKKCLSGSPPLLYVDLIVDNRDDALYQQLIHACLSREFSAFTEIDPEIASQPFDVFFRAIYDGLRSAFDSSNQMAANPGGQDGDPSNASGHGEPGKTGSKGKSPKK